ncbi:28258_t:CDS:1, partial [Dentiscutata erythropus]
AIVVFKLNVNAIRTMIPIFNQMEESASHSNILLPTALNFEDESPFVSINADRLSVKYIGE